MPIIYALVSDGPKVLCEFSENDGNFMQIARQILKEVPKGKHRRAYEADDYVFNFSSEDTGLIFLCMTSAGSEARLPWVYMADVRDRFMDQYGGTFQRYGDLGLNDTFGRVLREQMAFFNNNPSDERIKKIKSDITAVKDVMVQNIDRVLERGERIEILVEKTNLLDTQSNKMRVHAGHLKTRLWCKNIKLMICIGILCLILLIIIIVIIVVLLKVLGVY